MNRADLDNWYYQIEVAPGIMSGGRVRGTSSMTRRIASHTELEGTRCLDIGAQEGLLSVLLARQGAQYVAAYDRLDLRKRLAIVQQAYGVTIDYFHSMHMHELMAAMKGRNQGPFDVVVFAGVLYHMLDPLSGMAIARSFLREGGVAILETSVIVSDEYVAHFNAAGRFYEGSNYFQISLACFDYFARMLRMQPIDVLFTAPGEKNISRVALVCRAIDEIVGEPSDTWIRSAWVTKDMRAAHLDFGALRSTSAPIGYRPINPELVFRADSGCVDVLSSVKASRPHTHTVREGQLYLNDMS